LVEFTREIAQFGPLHSVISTVLVKFWTNNRTRSCNNPTQPRPAPISQVDMFFLIQTAKKDGVNVS
jgi:hypothetical protein